MTQIPDRKYAPPAPTPINIYASERIVSNLPRRANKDDLHEWSIYRQNLTSSIAEGLLGNKSVPGAQLPFGDFQMHDSTVESVLQQARNEEYLLAERGDVYLRFGLPRVALPTQEGNVSLYQQGNQFRSRKAASELDLRRAALNGGHHRSDQQFDISIETSSPRANYHLHSPNIAGLGLSPTTSRAYLGQHKHHNNNATHIPRGLKQSATFNSPTYADAPPHLPGMVMDNNTEQQQQHVGNQQQHQQHRTHATHQQLSPGEESYYWQSKRHHHQHYFSNLDLFTPSSNPYNYLRYAKAEDLQMNIAKQPHFMIKNVSFEADVRSTLDTVMLRSPKYKTVLENVSFELFGGETLAILYTSAEEIRTLFSVLTRRHGLQGRLDGQFVVNGVRLKPRELQDRIAYVCSCELNRDLTVEEYLRFSAGLVRPATNAFRTKTMILQLVQTLALAPFSSRLIRDLGKTEVQRVKVASQILLDTDIILFENICGQMDLYDAAFLIDYLRDWASKLNRIVIMAIHPPTFEMLAMFYKCALLASGRVMYFGKSNKMLEYFDALSYPCPLFKNPCDYYVDLVTVDYLTLEASFESTERIKRLAENWSQKAVSVTEMGPVGIPPPKMRRVNGCVAIWWLYVRFWMFLLNSPWTYASEVFYSFLMGLMLGATFYRISLTQPGIQERFGMLYALLILFVLPNLFQNIARIHKEKKFVYVDRRHRFYGSFSFFLAKVLFDFPLAIISYSCYVLPVYFMAELRSPSDVNGAVIICSYLGITVLHCLMLRMISWLASFMTRNKFHALAVLGFFVSFFAFSAGVTVHPNDIWAPMKWSRYVSPTQWAIQILARHEFLGQLSPEESRLIDPLNPDPSGRIETSVSRPSKLVKPKPLQFGCVRSQKTAQLDGIFTGIVVRKDCPIRTGKQVLDFANMTLSDVTGDEWVYIVGVSVIGGWGIVALILAGCFAICCHYKPKYKVRRDVIY